MIHVSIKLRSYTECNPRIRLYLYRNTYIETKYFHSITSDIRKCEVCGKSYEEARRSFNEVLRSNIIIPKIQSEKYRESLQKLLAEVKNFKEVIKEKGLTNDSLIDLTFRYWHYFDNDSTLYKFVLGDYYGYISEKELIWFEDYVKQIYRIFGIRANEALQDMQTWLETEIKERAEDSEVSVNLLMKL